jgi:hypothetical protein
MKSLTAFRSLSAMHFAMLTAAGAALAAAVVVTVLLAKRERATRSTAYDQPRIWFATSNPSGS